MIKIEIEKKTRKVKIDNALIGNDGENLQDTLQFCFKDEFVDGQARLELKFQTGETTFVVLDKKEETYTTLLSNVMTKRGKVFAQLVVTENGIDDKIPVFKSDMFYFICNQSINAEEEAREPYIEWIDRANVKLNEVDNLDIDANKVNDTTTITITKKDKSTKILEIKDGEKGADGTMNFDNLTEEQKASLKGDKGDPGQDGYTPIKGVDYFDGEQGPQGIQGEQGTPGEKGDKGDKGDAFTYADFTEEELEALRGPQGIQGPKGDTGPQGLKGDKGETGPQGLKGDTGPQGPQGLQGEKGEKGEKGETGADGKSATITIGTVTTLDAGSSATVENVGTNTNAIFNFGIPKGADGTSGTGGEGNVSSTSINSIEVVDELPETEVEGVLYLVKEALEPVVVNLYPSQVENTETNGFTVTFKERNVIANGSNDSASVWGWTKHFNMNLEANKTYYLQFTNVSGSFDDSKRISNSDGIVNAVILTGYDASGNSTNLINSVERSASGVYEKYAFTPTIAYSEYSLSMQVKKLNVFDNWTCSIVIAEEQ